MIDWRDLAHDAKVVLFVVSTLDFLKREGWAEGGWCRVADEFRDVHMEMSAEGFTPTDAEIASVLEHLNNPASSRIFDTTH
jgi:hypothetical protein